MRLLSRLGLRGKSAFILTALCLLALIPAAIIGWQAVDRIQRHFATAYVEQYTLQHAQRILAPVSRELALARRMANSLVTRQWLASEEDPELRARFFDEAEQFRRELAAGAYFAVVHDSGNYYFSDKQEPDSRQPRYRLDADDPADLWYFSTVDAEAPFNLNVDLDRGLGVTKVWINVPVRTGGEVLGVTGTGFELTDFLQEFIQDEAPGITPMIADRRGALQAHPSRERIAYQSGAAANGKAIDPSRRIHGLLGSPADVQATLAAMAATRDNANGVESIWVTLDQRQQLLAVHYLPELDWHVITALDPGVAQVFDERWLLPMFVSLLLLLAVLLTAFVYATNRLILTPLNQLKESARAVAAGNFRSSLPTARTDEIGDLSRTFADMAERIRNYTEDLETKVRERTQALEDANARIAEAHGKISDSIEYASIIQRAILPDAKMNQHLEHACGVLWKPRDVVGGDFYVFHPANRGYLLGVVDCAGHGVPGSLMTMLARAIIDNAILRVDDSDPAAILNEIDRKTRQTLPPEQLPSSISTSMDMGLVWVDPDAGILRFAGARMALYASDGEHVEMLRGHKRAIGHRRPTRYAFTEAPLRAGWTYYLCTDGFLDQAGGDRGFAFGDRRFRELLRAHATRPLDQQIQALEQALEAFRGELPQRDDITVLTFRLIGDRLAPSRTE